MKSPDGLCHPDSSQSATVVRSTHRPHLPPYHSLRIFFWKPGGSRRGPARRKHRSPHRRRVPPAIDRGTAAEVSTRARAGLRRAGPGGPASPCHTIVGKLRRKLGSYSEFPNLHLHPAEGRLPNAQEGGAAPCSIRAVARLEGVFRLPAGFKPTAQEYRIYGVGCGHSCR